MLILDLMDKSIERGSKSIQVSSRARLLRRFRKCLIVARDFHSLCKDGTRGFTKSSSRLMGDSTRRERISQRN